MNTRVPRTGDVACDALKQGATAASITATAVTTAATAATAFGIATAIGSAIPIPLLGTAIGAVVGAFTALGVALTSAGRDTFHPDAPTAAAWLLLFQIAPSLLYSGVDTVTAEGAHNAFNLIHPRTGSAEKYAARLVRYFRLVAGIINNPSGKLYNPNDIGERGGSDANPYMESATPDPGEHLTNVQVTWKILQVVNKYGLAGSFDRVPSHITKKVEAEAALKLLRSPLFASSGAMAWEQVQNNLDGIVHAVGRIRGLAGEHGTDAALDALFGRPVPVLPWEKRPQPDGGTVYMLQDTSSAEYDAGGHITGTGVGLTSFGLAAAFAPPTATEMDALVAMPSIFRDHGWYKAWTHGKIHPLLVVPGGWKAQPDALHFGGSKTDAEDATAPWPWAFQEPNGGPKHKGWIAPASLQAPNTNPRPRKPGEETSPTVILASDGLLWSDVPNVGATKLQLVDRAIADAFVRGSASVLPLDTLPGKPAPLPSRAVAAFSRAAATVKAHPEAAVAGVAVLALAGGAYLAARRRGGKRA